jgi:muramoyltetrapeptide carboxypeptidase LdcA involved in peptidoglycan recycling
MKRTYVLIKGAIMGEFKIKSDYVPTGDQPEAIEKIVEGLEKNYKYQTLLGVTGSGKTFTMANIIERVQKPTLVIAHNKTLAAQLCSEFKEFFPDNAVEYFVSYYDYYQPEAYVPSSDTYIEKDASINDEIDKLRHSATASLFERRDVIIVASVSCIYGLGSPIDYENLVLSLRPGMVKDRDETIRKLVEIQYKRNDIAFTRGTFRVRGDTVEIFPASSSENAIRVEFFGDEIDRITEINTITGEVLGRRNHVSIFPASHYATTEENVARAVDSIKAELEERLKELERENKLLEMQRLEQRTNYDIEMLQEMGYCNGIENYSRHINNLEPGARPYTLLDYFPKDFLMIIDESHMSIPQIRGMYNGDRARKTTLVEYGFRLPSALDNRPLRFDEFEGLINQVIFTSATPGPYEADHSQNVAEQIIRYLDYDVIRSNPKIITGYSDITILLNVLYQFADLITFHSLLLLNFRPSTPAYNFNQFFTATSTITAPRPLENPPGMPLISRIQGNVTGTIVGGNLASFVDTLGTPFEVDTKDRILFIEETHEAASRVYRMIAHLIHAGKFRDCAGIIMGECAGCYANYGKTYEDIINEVIVPLGKPLMTNLASGHGVYKMAIPIGAVTNLNTYDNTLTVLEPTVSL